MYVVFGACSYGILATLVKYANHLGIHTSALTFLQFFVGFIFLLALGMVKKQTADPKDIIKTSSKIKLVLWGISLGLTSCLYYLSIKYIPVSIAIILLMQSIWVSILIDRFVKNNNLDRIKIIGAVMVLAGTLLATNVFDSTNIISLKGLLLGFGAGIAYAISLYASSNIEVEVPNYVRSKYLVLGGLLLILCFWNVQIIEHIHIKAIYWGCILGIFGTIIPPLLFTAGIPRIGISLGNIIASIEIPVSILSALIVLNESVNWIQWCGVIIILISVVIVNLKNNKTKQEAALFS